METSRSESRDVIPGLTRDPRKALARAAWIAARGRNDMALERDRNV